MTMAALARRHADAALRAPRDAPYAIFAAAYHRAPAPPMFDTLRLRYAAAATDDVTLPLMPPMPPPR